MSAAENADVVVVDTGAHWFVPPLQAELSPVFPSVRVS